MALCLLVLLSSSSCSFIIAKPVPIDIPAAPVLTACPEKPTIIGTVSNDSKYVVLPVDQAQKLAAWIHDYVICTRNNAIDQDAYIQKLINRIKAVNGGK